MGQAGVGWGLGRKAGDSPTFTPATLNPPVTAAHTALRPRRSACLATGGWVAPGDPGRHPRGSSGTHLGWVFPTSRPRGRRSGAGEAGGQLWGSPCSPSACRAPRNPSRGPRCTGTPLRGGGRVRRLCPEAATGGQQRAAGALRGPPPAGTKQAPRPQAHPPGALGPGTSGAPPPRRTSLQPFFKRKIRCKDPQLRTLESKEREIQTPEEGGRRARGAHNPRRLTSVRAPPASPRSRPLPLRGPAPRGCRHLPQCPPPSLLPCP